jgi:hypothetical protein
MSTQNPPEQISDQPDLSAVELVAGGVSTAVGAGVMAREAAATFHDPTLSMEHPYNAEMVVGIGAGYALTVAAERLADHLSARGNERSAAMVERGKRVITWAGSAACQMAFATGAAAQNGDTRVGILTGFASTAIGISAARLAKRL